MAVDWRGPEVEQQVRSATMRGVVKGATAVHERAIKLILDPPKSGRIYRRRGVDHQSSAPGEAPANWTGLLAKSGRVEPKPQDHLARVTFSTAYARPLELGTKNMEPRPFLRRSLAEMRDDILGFIADELRMVFR